MRIMTIHFNNGEYHLDVLKNDTTGKFYIHEPLLYSLCRRHRTMRCKECNEAVLYDFDNQYTIGNTIRWIQVSKADYNYTWNNVTFYSGNQAKHILDMTWDEFLHSETDLPAKMAISFAR